jgi:hypothetical protein
LGPALCRVHSGAGCRVHSSSGAGCTAAAVPGAQQQHAAACELRQPTKPQLITGCARHNVTSAASKHQTRPPGYDMSADADQPMPIVMLHHALRPLLHQRAAGSSLIPCCTMVAACSPSASPLCLSPSHDANAAAGHAASCLAPPACPPASHHMMCSSCWACLPRTRPPDCLPASRAHA